LTEGELILLLLRAYPRWQSSHHLPGFDGGQSGRLLAPLIEEGIVEKMKRSRLTVYRLKVFDPHWIETHQWTASAVIRMGATDSPQAIGEKVQSLLMMNPHRRFCMYREDDEIWIILMKERLIFDTASD